MSIRPLFNAIPELQGARTPLANQHADQTASQQPVRTDAGPAPRPTPAGGTPQAEATNHAASRLQAAQDSLAWMQQMSGQGHGFARAELDAGYLQQGVRDAADQLEQAIDAEIEVLVAGDQDLDDAGAAAAILARFQAHPELRTGVDDAIAEVLHARQADALIDGLDQDGTPSDTLHALDAALQGAPAGLRERVLDDARVQAWIDDAAAQITGPLQPYLDDPGQIGHRNYPQDMLDAIRGLERVAEGLHPELAGALTEAALPDFEQVNESVFHGTGMFSDGGLVWADEGLERLVQMASHVSGAEGDRALIGRLIGLAGEHADWSRAADAVTAHDGPVPELARSIGPALFVELERQGIDIGHDSPLLRSMDSVQSDIGLSIQPDAAGLYELTETLRFAQEMRPLFDNDADYEAALDQLMGDTLGSDWQQQIQAQQEVLAGHGSRLLNQLGQYAALPADHALRPEVNAFIDGILADPTAQAAISMALRHDPSLAQGHQGEAMLDLFAVDGLGDNGQGLAAEFANLYIATNTGEAIAGLDPGDPTTFELADARLAALADPRLAAALGVAPGDLTEALGALRESLPGLGGDDAQRGAAQRSLNVALNAVEGFTADDAAGQIFRGLAVTASGSALINANGLSLEDPRVEGLLDQAVDNLDFLKGANFTGKSLISIAVGADLIAGNSFIGGYGLGNTLTGRLFAAAGIASDTWNAFQSFQDGNVARGSLHATAAGGALVGILGAGSWLGPVGWAAAAISYIGLGAVGRAEHNNRFETSEMREFLAASGLSDAAAGELYDTTGGAVSPVPFLLHYAQSHGLSAAQATDYFNRLATDGQLGDLVAIAHRTIDGSDGDGTGLPATHESDASLAEAVAFAPHAMLAADPASLAQVDLFLETVGVPRPD